MLSQYPTSEVLQEHRGSIFPVWLENILSWKDPMKFRISKSQTTVLEVTKWPNTDQLYLFRQGTWLPRSWVTPFFLQGSNPHMPIKSQSLLSKYQQIQLLLLLGRERLKKAQKNYQTSLQQEHQKYMLHSCSSFASAMYGSILGTIISLLYSLLCLYAPMDHIISFCHRSDRNLFLQ